MIGRVEAARDRFAAAIETWSGACLEKATVPSDVLSERSRLLGLPPPGLTSCNGSCRMFQAKDAWVAVNLPREEDRAMVPALLESWSEADPWEQLAAEIPSREASTLVAQGRLLGMAVARLGEVDTVNPRAREWTNTVPNRAQPWTRPPRVVDLSALWAGPLCGALLAEAGCSVIKAESITRPDTTRATPAFFNRLNGRKQHRALDLTSDAGRAGLASLLGDADVVITSARRRGLASAGIVPPRSAIWIAITGYGLDGPDSERIGFGDDCAVAGGLTGLDETGQPSFIGDAVADPLTGLRAAATALRALCLREPGLYDIRLSATARMASE